MTSPLSVSRLSRNMGTSTSHSPMGFSNLSQGLLHLCFTRLHLKRTAHALANCMFYWYWWPYVLLQCVSSSDVEVTLRPTVSRPVCLGVRRPSGTRDQFFFLLEISFRQLRVCYLVAPSLTRGWVCNLLYNYFWALPEQLLLGRSPAELTATFYCLIWDSPKLEGQIPLFISSRNRVSQLYPRALGSSFVASYDSQGLRWSYSIPPPHGLMYECKELT
jgi:hypothetical protein